MEKPTRITEKEVVMDRVAGVQRELSTEDYRLLIKARDIGGIVQNEMPITGMGIYTYQREVESIREVIEHYTRIKKAKVGQEEVEQQTSTERYEVWEKAKDYERAVVRYIEFEGTVEEVEKRKEKLKNQLNTLEKETLEYLESVKLNSEEYMEGVPINTNRK